MATLTDPRHLPMAQLCGRDWWAVRCSISTGCSRIFHGGILQFRSVPCGRWPAARWAVIVDVELEVDKFTSGTSEWPDPFAGAEQVCSLEQVAGEAATEWRPPDLVGWSFMNCLPFRGILVTQWATAARTGVRTRERARYIRLRGSWCYVHGTRRLAPRFETCWGFAVRYLWVH